MKKIIVTGGLGFIGSNLIELLLNKNYYVINVDKVTYSSNFYNTKEFNKNSLVKVIKILNDLNKNKYAKDFLKHLALSNIESGSEILSGNLAVNIGRYDYSIQIAKAASYEKQELKKKKSKPYKFSKPKKRNKKKK